MMRVAQHNKREHRRITIGIPIVVMTENDHHGQMMMTENISRDGLFVCTDAPFKLRQLVQCQLELPDTHETLHMLAMVTRITTAKKASAHEPAGIGIHLYGQGPAQRLQWEQFVNRMEDEYNRLFENAPKHQRVEPADSRAEKALLRRTEFVVHFKDIHDLASMLNWDFVFGGMFLKTNRKLADGSPVRLLLLHPEDRSEYPLPGRVKTIHADAEVNQNNQGLYIEFDGLTPYNLKLFREFVEVGLPELDLEETLLPVWTICDDEDEVESIAAPF